MGFTFGERSQKNLVGVHYDLRSVCLLAIELSEVEFIITEGMRSQDRQVELVSQGKSQTNQSKHLIGHAVDTAARIDGMISWDWKHYPRIAAAFRLASQDLGIAIVWGACWDRQLASLTPDLNAEVAAYKARRNGKAFIDGVHFELRLPVPSAPGPVQT